jgi:ApaG protein
MYRAITRGIEVRVEPYYLEDRSEPEESRYLWAYKVVIANHGEQTVQLQSRYWHITDALGRVQEVRGEGVVGEQPTLNPGDTYEYTSGAPLSTPSGMMVGSYQMVSETGERFDVAIPAFSLDSPHERRSLN